MVRKKSSSTFTRHPETAPSDNGSLRIKAVAFPAIDLSGDREAARYRGSVKPILEEKYA